MENTLIFSSDEEVRFGKLLKYIIPTYLTSLFNTVYTIIDGIFVSAYVGTDALAAINIVYPPCKCTDRHCIGIRHRRQCGCGFAYWRREKRSGRSFLFLQYRRFHSFGQFGFPDYHFKSVQDPDPAWCYRFDDGGL